jgi:hypothetical protein
MSAGKRYIEAVRTTADLPSSAQEGDLCWDYETQTMSVWKNGGWEIFQTVDSQEVLSVMTYDYDKQANILNVPETYTEINNYTSPSRPAGVYEIGMSFTYAFNQTNRSVYWRWSTDGGTVWNEFRSEPKDVQDKFARYYQYPVDHAGGPLSIITQTRKEDVLGVLDVFFSDVWFRRVA